MKNTCTTDLNNSKYNHLAAEREFKKHWKKTQTDCRTAGMSEEQIQELYDFERKAFNSDRSFLEHENVVSPECLKNNPSPNDNISALPDTYFEGGNDWLENLENDKLTKIIRILSEAEKTMLTLVCKEDLTHREAEHLAGTYDGAWKHMIQKIKKEFEC